MFLGDEPVVRYSGAMKLLPLLLLLACSDELEPLPPDAPTSGLRVELPQIEFNKWVDYLTLQGALDEDCAWMDPLREDDSVAYPPLQGFWVIYENDKDVEDGTVVQDTFFVGDRVSVDDFPTKGGLEPLGFKFPPPLQQSFLKVDEIVLKDGGRTLEADFGAPIENWMRAEAEPDGDGCAVQTFWCPDACTGSWSPLGSVFIELGAFYSVQSVAFLE